MTEKPRVAVLGGGSFGTVIANIMAENGFSSKLWMRDSEMAKEAQVKRENRKYLPGYIFSKNLEVTSDMAKALVGTKLIFVSVPSSSFRQVIISATQYIEKDSVFISSAKGVEPQGFTLMSQVLAEELSGQQFGVLSGPNLAAEISQRQITGTVIASESEYVVELAQQVLACSYFRVYSNTDVYGVELGGALKNIYAIAAGVAAAMGVGTNTMSMLITRSLAEMGRFASKLGANPMTFIGLSGVGDLIVTCMSPLSRNYRIGFALGEGKKLQQAVEEVGQVAEGVNTLRMVKKKADELDIYMPLVSGLYEVVFNAKPILDVVSDMMLGEQNSDVEFILN
jgi:glycerol-3-phosphate dehydrogenase (NAD(P)+)